MPEASVSLTELITAKRAEVDVTSVTYDFEYMAQKIINGDINITPSYQRLFEWDEIQQSRFIESLILNLPIPPVYFTENPDEDGRLELLDGLQRVCTYLHFTETLPASLSELAKKLNIMKSQIEDSESPSADDSEEDDDIEDVNSNGAVRSMTDMLTEEKSRLSQPVEKLVLKGCDILEHLNGKTFEDFDGITKRRIKSKGIDVYIYRSNNKMIKLQMFTRMNAGGSKLTSQQIRNARLRIVNAEFINFLNQLAECDDYQLVYIRNRAAKKVVKNEGMFLEEMLLRILAFSHDFENYSKDISPFIDKYAEKITFNEITMDYTAVEDAFKKTFNLLNAMLPPKIKVSGYINRNMFEALCIVAYKNILKLTDSHIDSFKQKLASGDFDSQPFIGGGKNTKNYYTKRFTEVEKMLGIWNNER